MSTLKKFLMAIPVVGAIATLNIGCPVLAANQMIVKIGDLERTISITALENFVKTGDTSGLPLEFSSPLFTKNVEQLKEQLQRPISIDPNSELNSKEQDFMDGLMPTGTEEERKAALTLMGEKGNGQITLDFLKVLPGDILSSENFLDSLNAYQPTPIKTPSEKKSLSFLSTHNRQVGTIDLSTGVFTKIADTPRFHDIALSENGKLFGVSTNSQLYSIDQSSGVSSLIGNLGVRFSSLGFSSNNVLYGASGSGFYTVDIMTGAASLVSSIPGFNSVGDIVFDPKNNQFLASSTSVNSGSNSLFSIDLTGSGKKIGDIGFNNVIGLFFDNETLFAYTLDRKQLIINSETGVGTLDKNVTGVNGLISGAASLPSTGSKTSVPEPSSMLGLLAFGTFGIASLLKRKQQ
ncbi:Putative exosortase, PEP-CTERM interaction domain protein (modular protein) [Planktothrix serta PCC 8927]|uniref:Exosortase, PEP-CTERM interaction domain protein (Modular protein) n=1 Tax=Planktothrix serta PCC 8927 TaxID=671068 RepID=A0A7Z9BZE3_9CYAN|nr:alpha/beta hydrolase [Planktothrix serta]VXD24081.1 Putative exosortase, PEP-CTERM interaction domain protein (modular protein) [Planktothrix serta PCC 8927]